jgi:hypothetical protein
VTPSIPRVVVDGRVQDSEAKTAAGEGTLALDPTTWDELRIYIKAWDECRPEGVGARSGGHSDGLHYVSRASPGGSSKKGEI